MRPILLLLLAACQPALDTSSATHCDVDGIQVTLEYRTDCGAIAANVDAAKRVIVGAGILTVQEFETWFAGMPVTVRAATNLGCMDEECTRYLGGWFEAGRVDLACGMNATLHELIHAQDWMAGRWGDDPHAWWRDEGYDVLDAEYRRQVVDGCY